jgi:hypothetical protein
MEVMVAIRHGQDRVGATKDSFLTLDTRDHLVLIQKILGTETIMKASSSGARPCLIIMECSMEVAVRVATLVHAISMSHGAIMNIGISDSGLMKMQHT